MSQKPSGSNSSMRSKAPHDAKEDKNPTYQELLDESLEETFPASDPIAADAAAHATRPVETPKDEHDWELQPGGDRVEGQQDEAGRPGASPSSRADHRGTGSSGSRPR